MNRLRTLVIGCGHLGRIHARLLSQQEDVDLVGVTDPRPEARDAVAKECGCRPFADYNTLLGEIDAAVIAAPTSFHETIARELIEARVHVLVEKPLAPNSQDCERLASLAQREHIVLAVGHVERFNPAFVAAAPCVPDPLLIEATRTGGFSFRSLDVGVVLDLMIHDIELILALVDSSVRSVSAVGMPVVTSHEDIAEARLVFANGCIAELKASRTSPIARRQMSIYGAERHVFVDLGERRADVLDRCAGLRQGTIHVERLAADEMESMKPTVFQTLLPTAPLTFDDANPLQDELIDFVRSVRHGRPPRVDGRRATQAVSLAEQIVAEIRSGARQSTSRSAA